MDRRVILVIGASGGLGSAIAVRFGTEGCRVAVHYRSSVQMVLSSGGEAVTVRADLCVTSQVNAMVESVVSQWGGIDVLVNSAGTTRDRPALRMSEDEWDDVLDTNLTGPFSCIRAAARVMMEKRSGHILSIASISGVQGREGQANYSASKAGLIGLTKAAAREFGPFNVRVNAVLPGYLPTAMGRKISEAASERIIQENVLRRGSTVHEVAEFIVGLSRMENVSGQVFNLDSRVF
jgi:3-oxoacyl-[acyl-carrier protein] reductase